MTDPVTVTLVAAFALGAAAGLKKVGEEAIVDAYSVLKKLVIKGFGAAKELIVAIDALEEKPESNGRKATLAEELEAAGAIDDEALIEAAIAVIKAGEASGQTVGVDWQDIKAAELEIGKIRVRAGAVGFRAARMEVAGKVTINEIDAAIESGN